MHDPMSIVVCLPEELALFDPEPEKTFKRDVRLVSQWEADTGGVVGWSTGGWDALSLAVAHPELPRPVIVSLPFEESRVANLATVPAETLLLYGTADPLAGAAPGRHWQEHLPNARLEMVPAGTHELPVPMWARVLSHPAPRRTRKAKAA